MRLFVGTRLGSEARDRLRPALEELVAAGEGALHAVAPGSEHLTHVFLGDRAIEVGTILEALEPLSAHEVFSISLGNAHVFPARGRPRLVCLGVERGEARVAALATAVHARLLPLFPDLEGERPKPPHVTLARFRKRSGRRDARPIVEALASWDPSILEVPDRVSCVELIRSELAASGARYETVGRIPLASAVVGS